MSTGEMFPIEKSNYFIMYKLEEQEIEKLKWIESEKAGYDIGYWRAKWMWMTTHRTNWLKAVKNSGHFITEL